MPSSVKPRVLLVNYLADEREVYGEVLRANGFRVETCSDPSIGLMKAAEWQPQVVVTRILQPGFPIDGIELTRRLKSAHRTKHIAVVIITALIEPTYREAASVAGCDGYLLLPCLPGDLVEEIRRLVARPTPDLR